MHKFIILAFLSLFLTSSVSNQHILVDFSKPSTEKRLCVIKHDVSVYCTYTAHGKNSGSGVYATSFSNKPGSYQSSLGRYRIIRIYQGRHGTSYQLEGLDSTNSNVRIREIVIHSAPYIGYGRTGHSEGCFAIPERDYKTLQQYLYIGEIIYARN